MEVDVKLEEIVEEKKEEKKDETADEHKVLLWGFMLNENAMVIFVRCDSKKAGIFYCSRW